MSLLLDALKKSEAQRRRGKPPALDLATTPPSSRPARSAWRWPLIVLPIVVLVAAAPWIWPEISSRLAGGQATDDGAAQRADDGGAVVEAGRAASGDSRAPAGAESVPRDQTSPSLQSAPVAGAERARRTTSSETAATETPPASRTEDARAIAQTQAAPERRPSPAPEPDAQPEPASTPEPEPAPDAQTQPASTSDPEPASESKMVAASPQPQSDPEPEPEPQPETEPDPRENFIRAWELPQAQRAEFPELNVTVHFYAPQPGDRFVRINGERYTEGQRVGPGVELVEIRRRGAVVDFAGYRVLIE
ncbi:MAG: general secretion pathway protein GspB [Wenzhouxiangellaceae bacterium]|nr:general secretion pathway protein GspB [Wenzhouxiangellaceae bacterium]